MKRQNRTCPVCGFTRSTFSKAEICSACHVEQRKQQAIKGEKVFLEKLGYQVLGDPAYDEHRHRKWRVVTPCCGKEYEPLFINVRSALKRTGAPPCSFCGGKKRAETALSGYVSRYGRIYDVQKFVDYGKRVRHLSERTLKLYSSFINPADISRGLADHHLDHRVSIVWCFKNGVAPGLAALYSNLQLLSAKENLKKGRKCVNEIESSLGLDVLNILDYGNPVFLENKLNVWFHQLESPALSGMVLHRRGEAIKLNARELEIRPVPPAVCRDFMTISHLSGDVPATYRIGLWDGDQPLSMVTVGPSRFSERFKYEVLRFATRPGFAVRGAAARLFAQVRRDLDGKIVSFSDGLIGTGRVYELCGFQFDGQTGPGYFWEKDGRVLQRYQTQKHKLRELLGDSFSQEKSETELMQEAGWRKVLTPGHRRWVL